MAYRVIVQKRFRARQGLPSPVRREKNLPPLQPKDGYEVVLRAGIEFSDDQINDRGWFVDTDTLDDTLDEITTRLGKEPWTEQFDFRPTFERVAESVYTELRREIPQLKSIELDNQTLGVNTVYERGEA